MATQPLPGFDPTQQQANPFAAGMYGNPGTPAPPSYNPDMGVMNNITTTQNATTAGAGQINGEALGQLGYYGPIQQQNQQLEATALQQLNATPGYTGAEASAIDPNFAANKTSQGDLEKQFLTGGEQKAIAGDPNAPKNVMSQGTAAEGAQLNAYGANLGGNVNDLKANVGGQVNAYGSNLSGQLQNLDQGLAGAQQGFSKLDAAVNQPGLGDQSQEKQLSDQDVQDMRTASGTTVGNMYRTSEDQLERNAAAQGNTSPLALSAARSRLDAQSAAGMGDAELQADIAAKGAQASRANEIESQRYGETANTAGMQAGAATTEQAQAQNAAALAGTTGVNAANTYGNTAINASENVGQAGINAANTYGQTAVNEASNAANQNYGAAATAESEAAQRAAALAGNRQQTQTGVNATTYGQGMATDLAGAQAAKGVADARIAGQGAYRSGVAQQQGLAQQGGQTAVSQQNDALKTQTTGLVGSGANATSDQGNNERNSIVNQSATLIGAITGHEKGGIITKPTMTMLGEHGHPEMVVPLMPHYKTRQPVPEGALV